MSKKPPSNQGDHDQPDRTLKIVAGNVEDGADEDVVAGEDVVIERRIDRRMHDLETGDRPWLRRIVGSLIIAASVYTGWKMMGARRDEMNREVIRLKEQIPAPTAAPKVVDFEKSKAQSLTPVLSDVATGGALVDVATATTISECTKGVDAFRLLKLDAEAIAKGTLTLEQIFAPVLKEERGRTKRITSLENIRIQTRDGRELRLHITPRDQKGRLFAQLFQVAGDGLPEEIEFPPGLSDFKTKPISNEMRVQFLQLADPPGVPIETERHENWSFADRSGVQLIVANDFIFDMQVFTKDRFLACVRANGKSVCKCIQKK